MVSAINVQVNWTYIAVHDSNSSKMMVFSNTFEIDWEIKKIDATNKINTVLEDVEISMVHLVFDN